MQPQTPIGNAYLAVLCQLTDILPSFSHVFAYAAAQVKKCLEVSKDLGAENYGECTTLQLVVTNYTITSILGRTRGLLLLVEHQHEEGIRSSCRIPKDGRGEYSILHLSFLILTIAS